MSTTEKRITLALTKEQLKELDELSNKFRESPSSIIHRAISLLYYIKIESKS